MRIFLTGGTGFIGSNFINLAEKKGLEIVALSHRGSEPRIKLDKSPFWVFGNLNDEWGKELCKCDAFIHMASYGVVNDSDNWEKCYKVNVLDSLNIWRQAISAGIKKFIIIGSCFEYGKAGMEYKEIPPDSNLIPKDAYSASKAAASITALGLAIDNNLDLKILRPFHVYGNGEDENRFWPTLKRCAQKNIDLEMTNGEQIRDFQNVEQTVNDILYHLLEDNHLGKPKVINLGSGNPKTLYKFALEEWKRIGSKGKILKGIKPYRKNEVMRYIPKL